MKLTRCHLVSEPEGCLCCVSNYINVCAVCVTESIEASAIGIIFQCVSV